MYNTLELLDVGESFIHWIKPVNTEFTDSILQVRVKLDLFYH